MKFSGTSTSYKNGEGLRKYIIYYIQVGDGKYYGHTQDTFTQRKSGHNGDFRTCLNRKVHKAMRELGMTTEDIKLIWVEEYPCDNLEQAKAREQWYVERYGT